MRAGLAILLSLALLEGAAAQPALPDKPIQPGLKEAQGCESYGFLEGSICGMLAYGNEPLLPVTDKETRLAFRLVVDRGTSEQRTQTILLRFELQSPAKGFFEAREVHSGNTWWMGGDEITPAEIAAVLKAAAKADVWNLPLTGGVPFSRPTPEGVEISICRHVFTLSMMDADRNRVLKRDCPDDKTDPALMAFARALIRIAQKHNPRIAADREFWPDIQ